MKYEMKSAFEERMKKLLPEKDDFEKYNKIIHIPPLNFIRCNILKISTRELFERLSKKWKITQPYEDHPEIMLINTPLAPGELGNSIEHLLGYYYVQELSSMLSSIALDPKPEELILDLCASPGSKTTQIASLMNNTGTLIANDLSIDRISILAANLERCGVSNTIITRNDGVHLSQRLSESQFKFDRILLDAPCSGEGTLRSSPKTFLMWNEKVVNKLSRMQKKLFANAVKCLKVGGIIVYSTCTHSPEENEEIINFALENFPLKIEKINLPVKCRPGIKSWNNKSYANGTEMSCRIYPQDNDSEGFFLAKFKLLEEIK